MALQVLLSRYTEIFRNVINKNLYLFEVSYIVKLLKNMELEWSCAQCTYQRNESEKCQVHCRQTDKWFRLFPSLRYDTSFSSFKHSKFSHTHTLPIASGFSSLFPFLYIPFLASLNISHKTRYSFLPPFKPKRA